MNFSRLIKNRLHASIIHDVKRGIADYDDNYLYWHNLEFFLMRSALTSTNPGIADENYFSSSRVVVSLTTYGKRLWDVYLAIESIMQQTVKPNIIILWLDTDLKNADLPSTLQNQMKRGLQIRYCKDIKSYKKLIPALHSFPEDIIITIDDDVLYSYDMIERLLSAYRKDPHFIYTNRMHRICLKKDHSIEKYKNWEFACEKTDDSVLNFPTGCGGVLYPPHSLSSEVMNEDVFLKICPTGDDIWFKAMSLINGVQCRRVNTHNPYWHTISRLQNDGLFHQNVDEGKNDVQIERVFSKYNIYPLLLR